MVRKKRSKKVVVEYDEPNWKNMKTMCSGHTKKDVGGEIFGGVILILIAAVFLYGFQWEYILLGLGGLLILKGLVSAIFRK
jgi:hypothetical protein